MQTDYEKQAQDFLTKHGIKFRATLSDSKVAPWTPISDRLNGNTTPHHYRVTLSRQPFYYLKGTKPQQSRLAFDFWGSIADAKKGKHPSAYDVLACISGDVHCAETFADFCSEFGEDEDSIKALQTFRRCSAFAKRLRAFFTAQEIDDLSEIQ